MPAILLIVAQTPDSPETKYRRGMVVQAFPGNHGFGWNEMPINPIGLFTVDAVNTNPNTPDVYGSVKMLDSGTITKGSRPLDVQQDDVIVWQFGGYFLNFQNKTQVPTQFYHVAITDKTVEQVQAYLERWNAEYAFESLQYDPGTGNRRVRITNTKVSASGQNAITQDQVNNLLAEWDGTLVSATQSVVVMDAILPPSEYDNFVNSVYQSGQDAEYLRRVWYISADGMAALENNNGLLVGSAAIVEPYLKSGLLD